MQKTMDRNVLAGERNGWAAARTGSIWPGAIAAPLMNLIVTALVLS